jgi:uncharacterized membrane protein
MQPDFRRASASSASSRPRRDRLFLAVVLALSSTAGLAMLAFRAYYAGTRGYSFMVWNLFLAWLPLAFAGAAVAVRPAGPRDRLVALGWAFLWLLFFPNAPYLCTEFVHLWPHGPESPLPASVLPFTLGRTPPLFFDAMLVLTFAWNGLVLGFLSLNFIHRAVRDRFGPASGWLTVTAASLLGGLGVSIGRFERWNSWDLFSRPRVLLADIASRVADPLAHPHTTGSTLLLAGFLLIAYLTLAALMRLPAPPSAFVAQDESLGGQI